MAFDSSHLSFGEFNFQVQQNIAAFAPFRGEMFIEHPTSKIFFLAPGERNISRFPHTLAGNIALRCSWKIFVFSWRLDVLASWRLNRLGLSGNANYRIQAPLHIFIRGGP